MVEFLFTIKNVRNQFHRTLSTQWLVLSDRLGKVSSGQLFSDLPFDLDDRTKLTTDTPGFKPFTNLVHSSNNLQDIGW